MSKEEKRVYDDGVERTKQTLLKCDYAITTTSALAKELFEKANDILGYRIETVADEMDSHFSGVDTYAIINDQDGLKAVVIKNAGEDAQSTLLY